MDNSGFLLAELDTAIARAHSIDLISFATSALLGLATVFLALATVLPSSLLNSIRAILFASTGVTVLFLFLLLRRLLRNRRARLSLLRKWQNEVFFAQDGVNTMADAQVGRMIDLIHLMEDSDLSRNPGYGKFDDEFMKMVK